MLGLIRVGDQVSWPAGTGEVVAVSDDGCWCDIKRPDGEVVTLPTATLDIQD